MKSHIRSLVAIAVLALFVCPACKYERPASTAQLGGHDISIRPYCDSSSSSTNRRYERDGSTEVVSYMLTCGDTTVSIRLNMLTVNGKSYGPLKDFDRITIDYGKVRVNSEVRTEVR